MRALLGTLVPAIVIALLINFYLAQSTVVLGQSMEPNLHQDQHLKKLLTPQISPKSL